MSEAPALLLAKKWEPAKVDPTGYWISEKLDGVRALWDGTKFISRLGNEFFAPDWFKRMLPNVPLDGELWLGRKRFQECVSIVRTQDGSKDWSQITYQVFDMPITQPIPFEKRLETLEGLAEKHIGVKLVGQDICEGVEHLYTRLAAVQKLGGEGLMLRQPGSLYAGKRSSTLLKVKTFLDDEAEVYGFEPGEGKHKGRLGALVVKWHGKTFKLGTGFTDQEREHPPMLLTKVTFRYFELSDDGIPRFPIYAGPAVDK